MAVGSYLELFLTSFGWNLYDLVWRVIVSTGLVYLPLVFVIIKNFKEPFLSQETKGAASTSLKKTEYDVIRYIVFITIAAQPSFTLQYSDISYTSINDATPKTVIPGQSGTTYDKVFTAGSFDGQTTKVPILFYIVMSVSGGINNALISVIPKTINFRQIEMETATFAIHDPHVRFDVKRFVTECYKPATADYFNNQRALPEGYTVDDIGWIGSKFFLNNIYKSLDATSPVPGFPFDKTRRGDMAHFGVGQVLPENGYPSCYEWWSSPEIGLRARLLKQVQPTAIQRLRSAWDGVDPDDLAIRELMKNEKGSVQDGLKLSPDPEQGNLSLTSLDGVGHAASYFFGSIFSNLGSIVVDVLMQPVLHVIITAAPYLQATILMCIYFLVPFALLVGGFEWEVIKTGLIAIFAVKFWTVIWAVVGLLDNKLYQSVENGTSIIHSTPLIMGVIDLITMLLYVLLPMFFMRMLGWAGVHGMDEIGAMASDMSSKTSEGGKEGGKLVQRMVSAKK